MSFLQLFLKQTLNPVFEASFGYGIQQIRKYVIWYIYTNFCRIFSGIRQILKLHK